MEFLYTYVRRPIFFSKPNVVRRCRVHFKIIGRHVIQAQASVDAVQLQFLTCFLSFLYALKAGGPFQIIKTLRLPSWKDRLIRDIKVVNRAFVL